MSKNQTTKEQHYIPKMILKRYATMLQGKNLIWEYDKNNNIEHLCDIKSVCKKKNLYELKDDKNNIITEERNMIENKFSELEGIWNKILNKIEKFDALDEIEIAGIYCLIALQILRTPESLKFTENLLRFIEDNFKNNRKRKSKLKLPLSTYARIMNLTINIIDNTNLSKLLDVLLDKHINFIVSKELPFILNGNRPVIYLNIEEKVWQETIVLFPFTPHIAIIMNDFDEELNYFGHDLNYFECDKSITKAINKQIFENEERFIYSSMQFLDSKSFKY